MGSSPGRRISKITVLSWAAAPGEGHMSTLTGNRLLTCQPTSCMHRSSTVDAQHGACCLIAVSAAYQCRLTAGWQVLAGLQRCCDCRRSSSCRRHGHGSTSAAGGWRCHSRRWPTCCSAGQLLQLSGCCECALLALEPPALLLQLHLPCSAIAGAGAGRAVSRN